MKTLTDSTKRVIKKHGEKLCVEAFNLYGEGIMGAKTVGYYLCVSTNTADALINAGREITG